MDIFYPRDSNFISSLEFTWNHLIFITIQSFSNLMSIFRSNFSRLHAYRSIDGIINISGKIFQHINPLCCLIFCKISFKSCLECPIPPFNNRSLKYDKNFDQATCSYFCSSRHSENLHLIFFNQYFSYEGIFSSKLIPFIR